MAARIYGLMAEFDDPKDLVLAAASAHEAGYRRMDAYSPFPIEELHEALGAHHSRLPLIVLIGGLLGCALGSPKKGRRIHLNTLIVRPNRAARKQHRGRENRSGQPAVRPEQAPLVIPRRSAEYFNAHRPAQSHT